MSNIAAIPSVALLAGCAAGLVWPDFSLLPERILLGAAVLAALYAWRRGQRAILVASVVVGFFAGGVLTASRAWHDAWRPALRVAFEAIARSERADAHAVGGRLAEDDVVSMTIAGVLRSDASPGPAGVGLSVDVQEVTAPRPLAVAGGVLLTVVGDAARSRLEAWRAGRTVRLTAQLHRPSRYLDPGVPDEERLLARRGTTLVGTVKSGALVDVVARGGLAAEAAGSVRAFVRRTVAESVGRWSVQAAGIVTAIVIGDRAGLADDVQRRLQEAGTYHVIAISGSNIAILAAITLAAFRLGGMLGRGAMLSAIAGLVAYGYLVGGGASVDRATLMAVVYFTGRARDLRGPPLNTLAVVAGLLVAADPLTIVDPAFLLTFGATAAILLAPSLAAPPRFGAIVAPIAAMAVASAAAEAALLPVGAAVFSRVTFAGLVLNFAAIPLMAVAQVAGMALVPVALVSSRLAAVLGWIAFVGAAGLVQSADLVRLVPVVTWRVAPPGWTAIVLYYGGLASAATLWQRSRSTAGQQERAALWLWRVCGGMTIGAAVWIVAEPWSLARNRGDGVLHVTFIDVGQGDAALVRFPAGASLLVDTGGVSGASSFDIGDRIVGPVLRSDGVRRLQALALTHGDNDHIGGAFSVIREFRPADVWEGIPVPPLKPLQALRDLTGQARGRWTNVQTGDRTRLDGVDVIVRHPLSADWERQRVRNDDSIVLELLWKEVSIVLTGDVGAETEQVITPRFEPVPLRIVKVPHHGSLTSSSAAFVDRLAPRIAVVSVGRMNGVRHPAPVVLDRYQRAGADVFRTDKDGAVTIATDGYSATVHTFVGPRKAIYQSRKRESTK